MVTDPSPGERIGHPGVLLTALFLMGVLLAACGPDDEQADVTADFTADPACFGVDLAAAVEDADVECGTVGVPLDHDNPDGSTIELAALVIPGEEGTAAAPPLVVLGGGPGTRMVEPALTDPQQLPAPTGRETVVIDQRGVGLSDPALECPEVEETLPQAVAVDDVDALVDGLAECRDRLLVDGLDLDAFNHRNNALDVDAVRTALGHDEIDVRGGSYGSHVALHAAALRPDGVRSLVLSSPIDPSRNFLEEVARGFEAALEGVDDACAASPECAEEVGDVEEAVADVADRLVREPEEVTVRPPGGERSSDVYTSTTFVDAVFSLYYATEGPRALPATVARARAGELEPLAERSAGVHQRLVGNITVGMQVAMLCTGEGGLLDLDAAAEGVDSRPVLEHWLPYSTFGGEATLAACETWDLEPSFDPDDFAFPEEVPTLVVTGEVDHVTPPEQGEAVAEALDTAHLVEAPGAGHGALGALDAFADGCGQQLVAEFHADPQSEPDDSCVEEVPPLEPAAEPPPR